MREASEGLPAAVAVPMSLKGRAGGARLPEMVGWGAAGPSTAAGAGSELEAILKNRVSRGKAQSSLLSWAGPGIVAWHKHQAGPLTLYLSLF